MTTTELPVGPERRSVSTLELFFDLVFVFAVTQLTAVLAVIVVHEAPPATRHAATFAS